MLMFSAVFWVFLATLFSLYDKLRGLDELLERVER
jgi:hypothetical protein